MKDKLFISAVLFACLTILGCSDDKITSKLPVFDKLTTDREIYSPGETVQTTLTFSYSGYYVKGVYKYNVTPGGLSGSFELGASESTSHTFNITAPREPGDYTITLKCTSVAAYAGESLFLDPAPMGSVSTTFTVQ